MSSKGKSKAPAKGPAKAPAKESKAPAKEEEKPKVDATAAATATATDAAAPAAKEKADKASKKAPAKEKEKEKEQEKEKEEDAEDDGEESGEEDEGKPSGKTDTDVFESTDNLGEKTYPIRAGEIKKGMIVILKDCPCKILEVTTSKTGKHGHAKANITGVDIFTGKKVNDSSPTSHNLTAPFVTTTNLTLTDITDDGYAVLMNEAGDIREDIKLPDINSPDPELGDQIRAALENGKGDVICVVTKAMDMECITSFKSTEA